MLNKSLHGSNNGAEILYTSLLAEILGFISRQGNTLKVFQNKKNFIRSYLDDFSTFDAMELNNHFLQRIILFALAIKIFG